MIKYRSKNYAFKANFTEQNNRIEDALKVQMLNNLRPRFKTYLTIVQNRIHKDIKLDDNKTIFEAVNEEQTWTKADQKCFANFTTIKSYAKP